MPWDSELHAFKTQIDLREYAAGEGYVWDRRSSSRSAFVMRRGRGDDKISIRVMPNGDYVYYSFRDPADHGSILDFVHRRKGLNLGEVRKELRPWAGLPSNYPKLEILDLAQVCMLGEFHKMDVACQHSYLERERAIPRLTLTQDRFRGFIRTDRFRNAIFPHYDYFPRYDYFATGSERDPCGWEIKNHGFTGFARGGKKGLWTSDYSGACPNEAVVICESAIDALSYATLFPGHRLYVSIAGQLSLAQAELITHVVSQVEPGVEQFEVFAATDADAAGERLADAVLCAAERSGRAGLRCSRHLPEGAKDWNEILVRGRNLGECIGG